MMDISIFSDSSVLYWHITKINKTYLKLKLIWSFMIVSSQEDERLYRRAHAHVASQSSQRKTYQTGMRDMGGYLISITLRAIKDGSVICTLENFPWRCFRKSYFGCDFSVNEGLYNIVTSPFLVTMFTTIPVSVTLLVYVLHTFTENGSIWVK